MKTYRFLVLALVLLTASVSRGQLVAHIPGPGIGAGVAIGNSISVLDHTKVVCASAATCAATLTGVNPGEYIVAASWDGFPTVAQTFTDTGSNSYTQIKPGGSLAYCALSTDGDVIGASYSKITTGGSLTVTVADGGNVSEKVIWLIRISGLTTSAFDQVSGCANQTGVNTLTTGNITTTSPNEILIGVFGTDVNGDTSASFTAGSGYSILDSASNATPRLIGADEDQIVLSSGSYSASISNSGSPQEMAGFVLSLAGTGSGATGHTFTLVQKVQNGGNCNGVNPCTKGSIPAFGAGHLLIAYTPTYNPSSLTLTGITGDSDSWTVNPGSFACRSGSGNTTVGYVLNSHGGGTSVISTWSGAATASNIIVYEYSYTPADGLAALDSATSSTNSGNPFPGVSPTISGSNDIIFQVANINNNTPTAISGGYTDHFFLGISQNSADLLNTTSTAAPTWSVSGSNSGCAAQISFK